MPSEKGSANSKFILKLRISSVKSFSINISQKFASLSLTMSKEVMIKRDWLFISIQSSRQRINDTFDLFEELIELLKLIKKNQKLLDENGESEEYIKVTKYYRIDISPPTQFVLYVGFYVVNLVNGVQVQLSQVAYILLQVHVIIEKVDVLYAHNIK